MALDQLAFQQFFAGVTVTPGVSFNLHGNANVLAQTVVGNVQINNIPFSVTSQFAGLNAFGHVATVPAGASPALLLSRLTRLTKSPSSRRHRIGKRRPL